MKSGTGQTLAAGIRVRQGILAFAVGFVSIACVFSLPGFLNPQNTAPMPTPVVIFTATRTTTVSPTVPTPTFSPTPTKIGEKTKTPTSTITPTPTVGPTFTPEPLVTRASATPTIFMDGLVSVRLSGERFYKLNCSPNSVTFTVQVADAGRVVYVVLFVRLRSQETGVQSKWTSITMTNEGGGTYSHVLLPEEIIGMDVFTNPIVEYQLVPANARSDVLGRTGIFKNRLSLITSESCTPTPTASGG